MVTIEAGQPRCTLINVYTVDPDQQAALVGALKAATDTIKHAPGFVSATIHASTDGTRVINYAQWTSEAALRAMLADQVHRPHIDALKELVGGQIDHHVYQVVQVDMAPEQMPTLVQEESTR